MPHEKRPQLLIKRNLSMVRLLIRNISHNRIDIRPTDCERGVPRLPCKPSRHGKRLVNPLGRIRFYYSYEIRYGCLRMQANQQMHMIRHSANRDTFTIDLPAYAAEIRMQSRADFLGDKWVPILRAENDMNVQR